MDPVTTVTSIIGGTKGIVDLAKTAIEFAKKEKNSSELVTLIQDIREKAQELREENLDLRNKLTELEKKLEVNEKLEFDNNNLLWVVDNGKKEGPYCSQCKDNDNKMIRLHIQPRNSRGSFHQCPTCKAQPDLHTLAPFKPMRGDSGGW